MSEPAITLSGVTKRFGAIVAVRDATTRFLRGRIHAVIGENGAGKSTLLSLAGGAHNPNGGEVKVDGKPLVPATPGEATRRGVGFVHQHFMLVEAFTALENVVLGDEPTLSLDRLDVPTARARALERMNELNLELDLDARVSELGVGERQTLEILRVLVRGARTILLDEPTAVLTPAQADQLFRSLRRMADGGACVVVVTHRLTEVMGHCDEVTVMRRGQVVSRHDIADTTMLELTRAIMGKEPPPPIKRPEPPSESTPALSVENLSVAGVRAGRLAVDDVSFSVSHGHIVGLAGVEGNGQQELVECIAGLLRPRVGRVRVDDREVTGLSVAKRRACGLSVVHADRHREGLMLDVSIWDNLVLGDLGQVNEGATVRRRIDQFGVVPPEPSLAARGLSGGNQQKVVTARALDRELRAVVLAQPTRGVDLGAARGIHEAICAAARSGAGVLIVSADLAELRAICSLILVIARGKIVAELSPESPEDEFGRAMLGVHGDEAVA